MNRKERTLAVYFEIVQFNDDILYDRDQQSTLDNEMGKLVTKGHEEWQQLAGHFKTNYDYSDACLKALKKTWKRLGKTLLKNHKNRSERRE